MPDFDIDVPDPVTGLPAPAPLNLDDELPQPGPLDSEAKRDYTLEEVAKLHRSGNRVSHMFHPQEVKAEIVRQIQERVPRT